MNEKNLGDDEQTLVQEARTSPLRDIIIAGFVDDNSDGKVFHPMMDRVYVKVGHTLFMLSSALEHSSLVLQRVMAIRCEFDIDEDDEFCTCSVAQLFLSAPYADSGIRRIDWFYGILSNNRKRTLRAMGLLLDRDEYIFFDPLNYFGIQIGGQERCRIWMTHNPEVTMTTSAITDLTSASKI